jgi:hypothetical protein
MKKSREGKFWECLLPFISECHASHPLSINLKIKMYKTIILPAVLHRCQTWSLTLREKYVLSVFENRALKRIFGPKREEVAGDWRRLRNEVLHNLNGSQNIIRVIRSRRMRWGTCEEHVNDYKCIQKSARKPEV